MLDFASSFGAVAISRAYADWSAPVNNRYQKQLVDRAVDLTQMFPTSGTKNGADIRLSIDVVEDLFRLADITHVVIVAGDSDYILLALSVRRLGRVVVGIGVTGSTSQAFRERVRRVLASTTRSPAPTCPSPHRAPNQNCWTRSATPLALLERALLVGRNAGGNVDDWMLAGGVKQQMKRLESSFDEKTLGFKSFTDFVKSRDAVAELQEDGQLRSVRLRDRAPSESLWLRVIPGTRWPPIW